MVLCIFSIVCEIVIVGKYFDDKVGQVYNVLFFKDIVLCRVQIYLVLIEKENEKFNVFFFFEFCMFVFLCCFLIYICNIQYMYLLIDNIIYNVS